MNKNLRNWPKFCFDHSRGCIRFCDKTYSYTLSCISCFFLSNIFTEMKYKAYLTYIVLLTPQKNENIEFFSQMEWVIYLVNTNKLSL